MIIKASQRSGATNLAQHLLHADDNEHIEVHRIKGFYTQNNVHDALNEIKTLSKGTKCKQFMFSVSLNPPAQEIAPIEYFEYAIKCIEEKMELTGQPHVLIFHEKEGRRHAHCIWSRINQDCKAINLPHYKHKLNEISKDLYLKYNWELPSGFIDQKYKDPLSFSLVEWQQAKRSQNDPRILKALFKQLWDKSETQSSFTASLQQHGFTLAQGNKRAYIAVDYQGEIYSLSRWTGVKPRILRKKLDKYDKLPTLEEAKNSLAQQMTPIIHNYIETIRNNRSKEYKPLSNAIQTMRSSHRKERATLNSEQDQRWNIEQEKRIRRLPKGIISSFIAKITGRYRKAQQRNAMEVKVYIERDLDERQELITKQQQERQRLQEKVITLRQEHNKEIMALREDIQNFIKMKEHTGTMQNITTARQPETSISHDPA